ncbi:tyrosine-type recombinase/integrase [Methylobacterium pseudosasicola]|uniref:Phage integrase family protein n=1 Tax=Methylobacterium pseudosasicola TaxID=582667 RepID=A0A1I4NLE3_9HYPH|nr:tyrosine-type recombinase/integrase [Methylobacterium pseudosasicola]SFM16309.1 Phage integrase family protein [Methylobacterium pseudosasicola]
MPRRTNTGVRYLAEYKGYYRVTMAVPRQLQDQLGQRLVKGLDTQSLLIAKARAQPVIAGFKRRIEDAWTARGGKKHSLLAEALEVRKLLEDADEDMAHFLLQGVRERAEELLNKGARDEVVWDPDLGPEKRRVPTKEAIANSETFKGVVAGRTPIAYYHGDFMRTLKISDRSKLDEPRALALFTDWLMTRERPIDLFIENVTRTVALSYMDDMPAHTGLAWGSNAKYFGRLKFYWGWLARRGYAKESPFHDLTIAKEKVQHDEEERAFTDSEIQRLFMGDPPEGRSMLDVMMVAALTGARLDAVIDLRVGECDDGWFTFKPQKKEKSSRDVPIHPDLLPIVRRRIEGKRPDDDLFPEWPAPKAPSVKPRSSYFSKRFTKYSRDIKVRDELEGKRRSLINFHSFRRWFITKMERAAVPGDLIAAIVGHKRSGLTLGRYSEGPDMRAAIEAVGKVRLPPLDGSVVIEDRGLTPRRRRQT